MAKQPPLNIVSEAIELPPHAQLECVLNLDLEQAIALTDILEGECNGTKELEAHQHDALVRILGDKLRRVRDVVCDNLNLPRRS
jgi:hypothetical protein